MMINLISDLSKNILGKLSVQEVLQTSADRVVEKFKFLGGIILLVGEDNKLYARTISSNKMSKKFMNVLGSPITELSINLKEDTNNYIVQSILKDEIRMSNDLYDFTRDVLNKPLTRTAEIITGAKSSIVIPLRSDNKPIGAIFFATGKETDFSDILSYLQLIANLISIAIINAEGYEDLEEALRREKDMMDVLAHELKTPLTVVKNSVDLLEYKYEKQPPIDPKQVQLVRLIKSNIDREVGLLEAILTSAKLGTTSFELNKDNVNIKDVLNSTYESFRSEALKKNLEFYIRSSLDKIIEADALRLQQILDNLVSNAIKYTDSGKVEIGAKLKNEEVEFFVNDTGEGISKENIKKIGKKFYRIEKDAYQGGRPSGTGIGLYVAFGLIKKMGGSYKIESELGKGSRFSFRLKTD